MTPVVDGIDVHAHGVPAAFLKTVAASGLGGVSVDVTDDRYVVTFPGSSALRPVGGIMLDFEQRLDWLNGQGMEHQLLAPWLDVHGQSLPAGHGRDWVRLLNDGMAESVASSGGRLRAHATLHLADAEEAARELERSVRELGMTSCMLPTHFPQGELWEDRYDVLWEAAASLRAPVVLHPPTESPSACMFGGMPELKGLYGRPIDTTVTASQLIVTGVLDRFPDLQVVLVHGGGFLPYQAGRFDRDFAAGDGPRPSEHIRRFHYDTVLMSAPALRFLFDLVGTGQVVIGSDYAAGPKVRSDARLTDELEATGIGADEEVRVRRHNAAALFRVPERAPT